MDSSIIHVDGDDFFASLARLKHPRLKGHPLVIGNLQSRGYVIAASYEARSAGVHRGLTMSQAGRICPRGSLLQIDWESAQRASSVLFDLLSRYSPYVERSALDAMFLDYTGCGRLFGPPPDFARRLQTEIREELKLSVSVGLSADKAVSAVACRAAKLGNMQTIVPGTERAFLAHCPVEWLPGITRNLGIRFRSLGIDSISSLGDIPGTVLYHVFGPLGTTLSRRATGTERAKVRPKQKPDEPQVDDIFPGDLLDLSVLEARAALLSGLLGSDLRQRQRMARYILLRMTYSDGKTVQRQTALRPPGNRDPEIMRAVRYCLHRLYIRRVRVRCISLVARHITYCPPALPFGQAAMQAKWDRALSAVDRSRIKYRGSTGAVHMASAMV